MLKKLKEIFLEPLPIKYEYCINCGKKLTGRQSKFCSNKCNYQYWNKVRFGRAENRVERRLNKDAKKN